ncbi:NCK-interacting protein with SH3 domain [Atheta coriaria]|uniref:NCK-interacting protein with SH3 domain n=1 Tax=Dalotia coriaria TaxID=877792 RepID=UPI0031F3C01E
MSNTILKMDNLEMLRSLYDFQATYTKTLTFKSNDYFILHQTTTKHKNWWEVINEHGEMGYIPSNYVEAQNVTPSFYNQWLENVIDYVSRNEIPPQYLSSNKKELLTRLKDMKRKLDHSTNENGTGPELLYKNSDGVIDTIKRSIEKFENEIDLDQKPSKENSFDKVDNEERRKSTECAVLQDPMINKQNVYELVESVRINTQLSHEMSRIAVATVVQGLHELLPGSVFPHLSTILTHTEENLSVDDVQIEQTHDASRLKIIFHELTYCKEDSQQRSWMLHEDEDTIKDYLIELRSILSNADPSITKHVISQDHYHVVITLIQYYQMEVRWSIRQLLLQVFGCMCGLEKTILVIMLNSVLPGELARDMLANPNNATKLNYSALLLTMMFSMGEPMPVTHLEFLGSEFLRFILDNIECPPEEDYDEDIPDLFVNFILSFNLQFDDLNSDDNIVVKALAERDVAKHFTEKILLLFNRDEDPSRIFDHEPAPPHSVVKLFNDLFNVQKTADLFYTNDVKVCIDITVRNISDLSAGDKRRHQHIELCRRIVRNTNYSEHMHQRDEILKCFTRIFCEESGQSVQDQKLVKEIINEFPEYFK